MSNKAISAMARQYQIESGWGKCEVVSEDFKFYGLPIRPIYKTK